MCVVHSCTDIQRGGGGAGGGGRIFTLTFGPLAWCWLAGRRRRLIVSLRRKLIYSLQHFHVSWIKKPVSKEVKEGGRRTHSRLYPTAPAVLVLDAPIPPILAVCVCNIAPVLHCTDTEWGVFLESDS